MVYVYVRIDFFEYFWNDFSRFHVFSTVSTTLEWDLNAVLAI